VKSIRHLISRYWVALVALPHVNVLFFLEDIMNYPFAFYGFRGQHTHGAKCFQWAGGLEVQAHE